MVVKLLRDSKIIAWQKNRYVVVNCYVAVTFLRGSGGGEVYQLKKLQKSSFQAAGMFLKKA